MAKPEKPKEPVKTKLKKGDRVIVIAGANKGQKGKILSIDREKGRAVVEKVNMVRKHMKKKRANETGGIIDKEGTIHLSNLMYLHQDKPTRLGARLEVLDIAGSKETIKNRIAISNGDIID
jgi:large subunit ribosomal protein L24